jgi:hypothetical protein
MVSGAQQLSQGGVYENTGAPEVKMYYSRTG